MINKKNYIIGVLFYLIAIILMFTYLILEFTIYTNISSILRLIIIILIWILMQIGFYFIKKTKNPFFNKLSKVNLYTFLALYIVFLLNLTIFDRYFSNEFINFNIEKKNYYPSYSLNLFPFQTIKNYFVAFNNGNLSIELFLYNILGNILIFCPLAILLPKILYFTKKWYNFFIVTSIFIIAIESLQYILKCGILDIDDYILNIFGLMTFYFILKNKKVSKFLNKLIYLN